MRCAHFDRCQNEISFDYLESSFYAHELKFQMSSFLFLFYIFYIIFIIVVIVTIFIIVLLYDSVILFGAAVNILRGNQFADNIQTFLAQILSENSFILH